MFILFWANMETFEIQEGITTVTTIAVHFIQKYVHTTAAPPTAEPPMDPTIEPSTDPNTEPSTLTTEPPTDPNTKPPTLTTEPPTQQKRIC